jgi:hypothetical protein
VYKVPICCARTRISSITTTDDGLPQFSPYWMNGYRYDKQIIEFLSSTYLYPVGSSWGCFTHLLSFQTYFSVRRGSCERRTFGFLVRCCFFWGSVGDDALHRPNLFHSFNNKCESLHLLSLQLSITTRSASTTGISQ